MVPRNDDAPLILWHEAGLSADLAGRPNLLASLVPPEHVGTGVRWIHRPHLRQSDWLAIRTRRGYFRTVKSRLGQAGADGEPPIGVRAIAWLEWEDGKTIEEQPVPRIEAPAVTAEEVSVPADDDPVVILPRKWATPISRRLYMKRYMMRMRAAKRAAAEAANGYDSPSETGVMMGVETGEGQKT
jgi:hypothetical protein